ncbi:hypothetical protein QUH34_30320, partial [Klebsiella pneumoniae]|nr:hypothetical protein [Klebsiella pneumoniae]
AAFPFHHHATVRFSRAFMCMLLPLAAAERPERSDSVSEEAEKRLDAHFLLTHLCGISHPAWGTFHTIRTDAA